MARNASGTYALPAGNPVVAGTTIEAAWANTTLGDVGTELTDSLSRSAKGGMLAVLKAVDGTTGGPGYSFVDDPDTGVWRSADNVLNISTSGVERLEIDSVSADFTVPVNATAGGNLVRTVASQVFTSSGTWTKPSGLLYAVVEAIGAGGGGGAAVVTGGSDASCGAGGGGGEYAIITLAAGDLGATETVTIGAGGAGGTTGAGSNGGDTVFGAHLVDIGGGSGGGSTTATSAHDTAIGGAGGDGGTGGDLHLDGQGGAPGVTGSQNTAAGGGGCAPRGGGGARGRATGSAGESTGVTAQAGGGGGGAANGQNKTDTSGGAGGAGFVYVTEYIG